MATVEFCLKSMCFMQFTHIVVRMVTPNGHKVLGGGDYQKILRRFSGKRVCSSSVSDNVLYIDVYPDKSSCDGFVCRKADSCILLDCAGIDCPLCQYSICTMCTSREACRK